MCRSAHSPSLGAGRLKCAIPDQEIVERNCHACSRAFRADLPHQFHSCFSNRINQYRNLLFIEESTPPRSTFRRFRRANPVCQLRYADHAQSRLSLTRHRGEPLERTRHVGTRVDRTLWSIASHAPASPESPGYPPRAPPSASHRMPEQMASCRLADPRFSDAAPHQGAR